MFRFWCADRLTNSTTIGENVFRAALFYPAAASGIPQLSVPAVGTVRSFTGNITNNEVRQFEVQETNIKGKAGTFA